MRDANGNEHGRDGRFVPKPVDDGDLEEVSCHDWAKARMVDLLWRTAKVEVRGLTFPDTKDIANGMTPSTDEEIADFAVVVNLKRAWQYLFDNCNDWIDWQYIAEYNRILGEGIVSDAGRMRTGGCHVGEYFPPIPREERVAADIFDALSERNPVDKALHLYAVAARGQWFNDGNKRTAAMAANHSLIHDGVGVLALPPDRMSEYTDVLVNWYMSGDLMPFMEWMRRNAVIYAGDESASTWGAAGERPDPFGRFRDA
ncbi:MAG: Fic family protein [Bifidobacterium dentium]|nr:Fic family protein [Bifidobacterium dentium]